MHKIYALRCIYKTVFDNFRKAVFENCRIMALQWAIWKISLMFRRAMKKRFTRSTLEERNNLRIVSTVWGGVMCI
jgi:hypothetical protein